MREFENISEIWQGALDQVSGIPGIGTAVIKLYEKFFKEDGEDYEGFKDQADDVTGMIPGDLSDKDDVAEALAETFNEVEISYRSRSGVLNEERELEKSIDFEDT